MKRLHLCLAVFWIVPGLPIAAWVVFTKPQEWSMLLLLFVSFWALTASHWSAYQATRAEEKVDTSQ